MEGPKMSHLNGLIEVILFVKDMDAQVRYYQDVLGLTVKNPPGLSDYSDQYWVELQTGACTLVLHGGGQGRIGEDAPKFAFQVSDIRAARAALLERGARLGEIRSPAPGIEVCDGVDPEGNHFSLDAHP
jgi:catechol 2,3-dioxygenase-like lactoylglutathione lyase family enzyme